MNDITKQVDSYQNIPFILESCGIKESPKGYLQYRRWLRAMSCRESDILKNHFDYFEASQIIKKIHDFKTQKNVYLFGEKELTKYIGGLVGYAVCRMSVRKFLSLEIMNYEIIGRNKKVFLKEEVALNISKLLKICPHFFTQRIYERERMNIVEFFEEHAK